MKCSMCCNASKCENSLFYAVSGILIHVIGLFLFLYHFPVYGFNEHYAIGNSDARYVNLFDYFKKSCRNVSSSVVLISHFDISTTLFSQPLVVLFCTYDCFAQSVIWMRILDEGTIREF